MEWIPEDSNATIRSPSTGDDPVLGDVSETCTRQVQSIDHLGKYGYLSADDLHVGEFGTLVQSLTDRFGDLFIGLVQCDVIDEGHGFRAYADGVVDVHGYAVDTYGVPYAELLRYQKFGSDTVRGKREIVVAEVYETGEKVLHMDHLSDSRPGVLQFLDERFDSTRFLVDVDSCFGIGPVLSHVMSLSIVSFQWFYMLPSIHKTPLR